MAKNFYTSVFWKDKKFFKNRKNPSIRVREANTFSLARFQIIEKTNRKIITPIARSDVEKRDLRYTISSSSRFVSNNKEGMKRSMIRPNPKPSNIDDEIVILSDRRSSALPINTKTTPQCIWCHRSLRVERVKGFLKYSGTIKNKSRYQMIPIANATMKYKVVSSRENIKIKKNEKIFW